MAKILNGADNDQPQNFYILDNLAKSSEDCCAAVGQRRIQKCLHERPVFQQEHHLFCPL